MGKLLGLILLTFVMINNGCSSTPEAEAIPFEGTEWTLTMLGDASVPTGERIRIPTLKLDPAGKRASGTSGVNRYTGGYELNGANIKFGQFAGTRMAGPPDAMARESAFLAALQQALTWKISGNTLELGNGEKTLLQFKTP